MNRSFLDDVSGTTDISAAVMTRYGSLGESRVGQQGSRSLEKRRDRGFAHSQSCICNFGRHFPVGCCQENDNNRGKTEDFHLFCSNQNQFSLAIGRRILPQKVRKQDFYKYYKELASDSVVLTPQGLAIMVRPSSIARFIRLRYKLDHRLGGQNLAPRYPSGRNGN